MINREDMLELTRRMTPSRTCMDRIAGGYMDEDGFLDGSFNIHFLKLSGEEKAKNLALAKAVPFSKTNEQLKEYEFSPTQERPGSLWQLLMGTALVPLENVWPTILTYSLASGALVGGLGSMFSIRKHLNV